MTVKDMARQGVRDHARRLAGLHSRELVLLEIGIDPEALRRHDGQQVGALRHIGSDPSGAIADIAANGCTDFGITEIEPGGLEIRLRLRYRSRGLANVGVETLSC